jgi:small subunit ribosomal protein S16
VSILGHYNPHTKELVIDKEEVKTRLSQGARPSNTVAKLLTREKVDLPDWVKIKTKTPKATEAEKEAENIAKPAAAEPVVESVAPALEEAGERVAEVNEEAATEAEANVTPIDHTDTAADEDKALEEAEKENSL